MSEARSAEIGIINIVLDEFLEITQIDPSIVGPDNFFVEKLGISERTVGQIFQRCSWKLKLMVTEENIRYAEKNIFTLRDLVEYIGKQNSQQGHQAA